MHKFLQTLTALLIITSTFSFAQNSYRVDCETNDFAGEYVVIESDYYRIGVQSGLSDWVGETRFIESIDNTTFFHPDYIGPLGTSTGIAYEGFIFNIDGSSVNVPHQIDGETQPSLGTFFTNCQVHSQYFTNVDCANSNKFITDPNGKHKLYLTYGYYTDGSGEREFYEVLEKVVNPCRNFYTTTIQTCDPQLVGEQTYYCMDQNLCDSIITVHYELKNIPLVLFNATTCDPTEAGVSYDTIAVGLCDSIVQTTTIFEPLNPNFDFQEIQNNLFQFTAMTDIASSYNWTFGDGNTSSERNPQHQYSTPSTYAVNLMVSLEGCSNAASTQNITIVGLNQISYLEDVTIYPNPSSGDFTLILSGQSIFQALNISIFNLKGNLIKKKNLNYFGKAQESFHLNNIASGKYILVIHSNDEYQSIPIEILK